MKYYDFLKAKRYIDENRNEISEASLGMDEDWGWTAETIFENGEYVIDLEEQELLITGISGSTWATPTLEITYKDGRTEKYNCYTGESDELKPFYLGCISEQIAMERSEMERKEL